MKQTVLHIIYAVGLLVVVAYVGNLALSADPGRNFIPRLIGFLAIIYLFCKAFVSLGDWDD